MLVTDLCELTMAAGYVRRGMERGSDPGVVSGRVLRRAPLLRRG
jgi:hypothetical protein